MPFKIIKKHLYSSLQIYEIPEINSIINNYVNEMNHFQNYININWDIKKLNKKVKYFLNFERHIMTKWSINAWNLFLNYDLIEQKIDEIDICNYILRNKLQEKNYDKKIYINGESYYDIHCFDYIYNDPRMQYCYNNIIPNIIYNKLRYNAKLMITKC